MVSRPGKYQPRFTSGELDPLFSGNTDQSDYFKGAQLMQNVRPFPQGGFGLMPGTKKLGRARTLVSGAISPVSIRSFTRARNAAYDAVFTEGWVDIYGTAGVVASVAHPFSGQQCLEMTDAQQLDTMLICHPSVQPQRLRGNAISWTWDTVPFANIPLYDYGGTYTNGEAALWTLNFFNGANGNRYVISVNGQDSTIATGGFGGAFNELTNLTTMLSAMPGLAPGWSVTLGPSNTPSGRQVPSGFYGIEFTGAANKGDGWAVSGRFLDNPSAAVSAAHDVQGVIGGEAIMSVTQGWPGAVLFYGGRTLIGGFLNAPNQILASMTEDLFNLDTRLKSASAPFLMPIDTRGAATILHLHHGRTLMIFTDGGVYWINPPTLDKTAPPAVTFADNVGALPTARPVEFNGATYFVNAAGGSVHEMRYDFGVQNYRAPNIAVRASSLVKNVVGIALRTPWAATDTAQLYAVRADGVAAVAHLLPDEEIRAFTRRVTAGSIRAANVNDRRDVTLAVERPVGASTVLFVERENDGYLLDGAQDFAFGAPAAAITGLSDFAGQQIWVIGDNVPQGPFTVPSAAPYTINLNWPAQAGYVGRWTPPRVLTMPQPRSIAPNTVMKRPCRVHTVRLLVQNTSSIAIGANGQKPFDVPLTRYGADASVPLLQAPFSGEIMLEGLQGFSDDGVVEITQLMPGTLTVKAVTVEVDL